MQTIRQNYIDSTIDEAVAKGCDCVQLKYDGWWSRIVIRHGTALFFSQTERLFKTVPIGDMTLNCTLIGEHMHGTQWAQHPNRLGRTFVFDCWVYDDQDYESIPYRDRNRLVKQALAHLSANFTQVINYHISTAKALWDNETEMEGLVFRNSMAPVNANLYRQKRIITRDLKATGFVEGEGKHVGRLGAIQGLTTDGVQVLVGGGFTDADRDEIWANRPRFMGLTFEVEARAQFASGSLRHPNFVKWKVLP